MVRKVGIVSCLRGIAHFCVAYGLRVRGPFGLASISKKKVDDGPWWARISTFGMVEARTVGVDGHGSIAYGNEYEDLVGFMRSSFDLQ